MIWFILIKMKEELKQSLRKYVLAAVFGTLGGLVTVFVIIILDELIKFVWEDIFNIDITAPTRTLGVFISMFIATVLVGFIVKKYGKIKTGMEELLQDIVKDGVINWRVLPKAVIISLPSLVSGASLGPEAPSAIAGATAAGAAAENLKFSKSDTQIANAATFSGMLGSILSSPFLAPAMIAETAKSKINDLQQILTAGLIGSAFGTATFFFIFGKIFTFDLPSNYSGSAYKELLAAFMFGILGTIFAAIIGKMLGFVNSTFDKIAKSDFQLVLLTGVIVAVLMYAFPLSMFSGQHTLDDLYNFSLGAGFISLFILAIVKMSSTALMIRAGFIGGAVFPALFTGSAFGLALNQIFNVSPMVAVGATTVGLLVALLKQPVSAAILTLLIFGFNSGATVACGLAGSLLILSLLPKKQ